MSLASSRSNSWIILRGPCWYPRVLLGGDCDDIIVEFPISCGQQRWALEPRDTRRAEGAPGRSPQEVVVILDNPSCSPAASTSIRLLPDRAQIQATVTLPCKVLAALAADSSYTILTMNAVLHGLSTPLSYSPALDVVVLSST